MAYRLTEQSIDEVDELIRKHCEFVAAGNSWRQEPYKLDFARLFRLAYWNGYSGERAKKKYSTAYKRRRSATPTEFVICGDYLRNRMAEVFLIGKNDTDRNRQMLDDFRVWWDEWTYAWEFHPNPAPRKYVRRK